MTNAPPTSEKPRRELGLFAGFWVIVGVAVLGVTLLGALNTAMGWKLSLSIYGSATPLPAHWDTVFGLGAAGILIIGLSFFGSTVAGMYRDAEGKPLRRAGILAVALVLLVVAGRGLQIVALTSTYGSMLAYYCTDDGTLEDVQAELDASPTSEELDECIGRTAQWDRADLLPAIIAAGGNFRDESSVPEYRGCVLGSVGVGAAYIRQAIELGASPGTCPNSDALVWQRVDRSERTGDAETAEIVRMLLAAGWSAEPTPEYTEELAVAVAKRNGLTETAAALGDGP